MLDKEQLVKLVEKLTASVVKRYRTEVLAEIDTNIETLLLEFRDHVVHRSWLAAQKWCRWDKDKFVLFPDYTRIYYRKGTREVLVQEYPPQVRVMSFKERLAKCKDGTEAMKFQEDEPTRTYSLALPYLIFIFVFEEGLFSAVYVGFSDRPLKDCHEPMFRPYLPNIDSTLKLCLGKELKHNKLIRGNVSQQAAYILSHFWQTTYCDEWSQHYWMNKSHFMECDPRMATLEAWQEASIDNSLFVIEDVKWLPHAERKVGDIIMRIFENEPTDVKFGNEIYDAIYQMFQETIRKTVVDQLESVESKFSPNIIYHLAEELELLIKAKIGD
jgi:hypothetical protein